MTENHLARIAMVVLPLVLVACVSDADARRPAASTSTAAATTSQPARPSSDRTDPPTSQPPPAVTTTSAAPDLPATPERAVAEWASSHGGVEGACSDHAPLPGVTCFVVAAASDTDPDAVYALVRQRLRLPTFLLVRKLRGGYEVADDFVQGEGSNTPAWMSPVALGGPDFFTPHHAVQHTLWSENRAYQGTCEESGYSTWRVCSEFSIGEDGAVRVALLDSNQRAVEKWRIEYVPERDRYLITSRFVPVENPPQGPVIIVLPSATWNGTYVDEPTAGPLRIGHAGGRVSELQSALGSLGLLADPIDGRFGLGTEQAVVALQSQLALRADGIAGAAIFQHLGLRYVELFVAARFLLGGAGIGHITFGAPAAETSAPLDAVLGTPTVTPYAMDPISPYPALEVRCYANGLCVILGGDAFDALAFRGWTYHASADSSGQTMRTPDGVTIGSTTAELPALVRRTGAGCRSSVGVADPAASINVTFDDRWEPADQPVEPAPEQTLTVVSMSAGELYGNMNGCS